MFGGFSLKRIGWTIFFDLSAALVALALALQFRFEIGRLPNVVRDFIESLGIESGVVWEGAEYESLLMPHVFILVAIIWPIVFNAFSVYDGRRNSTLTAELKNIMIATSTATLVFAGVLFFTYRTTSRGVFVLFYLINLFILINSRALRWAYLFKSKYRSRNRSSNVLIIGAGEVGRQLHHAILESITYNLNFIGFLDDDPQKQQTHPSDILGCSDDVRRIVKQYEVNDVILALPRYAHEKVSGLVSELHDLPVKVWVVPDYFALTLYKANMLEFAGIPMLDLRAPAINDRQRLIKRTFDIVVTTISLILLFPVFITIAIIIKIDSPGPIFFRQKRVGENGQFFMMYKFRSMIPDADIYLKKMFHRDKNGNLVYKTEDDPRITRFGKFLRRTSLDELPQFFNVILGDMSLVGPRPEIPYLVERYEPWQRTRFAVPQGITGWWQIHGRSDKPMHLHTQEDIYYVQNYSLLLDIKILLQTPTIVLKRKGAY
jgi:exopolysaccharide biosynthesis polyprenyl glycosylphosphotransferase